MLQKSIRLEIIKETVLDEVVVIEKIHSFLTPKYYTIVNTSESLVVFEGKNNRRKFRVFDGGFFKIDKKSGANILIFNYIAMDANEIIFLILVSILPISIAILNSTFLPLLCLLPFLVQSIYKYNVKKEAALALVDEITGK
jgi:hypothetical protein